MQGPGISRGWPGPSDLGWVCEWGIDRWSHGGRDCSRPAMDADPAQVNGPGGCPGSKAPHGPGARKRLSMRLLNRGRGGLQLGVSWRILTGPVAVPDRNPSHPAWERLHTGCHGHGAVTCEVQQAIPLVKACAPRPAMTQKRSRPRKRHRRPGAVRWTRAVTSRGAVHRLHGQWASNPHGCGAHRDDQSRRGAVVVVDQTESEWTMTRWGPGGRGLGLTAAKTRVVFFRARTTGGPDH